MPSLTPVDESFLRDAPERYEHTWEIARGADSVWGELVGDRPLHWINGLGIRWTSARPFGVGATRVATILGLIRVQEHFFRWEEGRRHSFYATAMNAPLFRKLAEDFCVEAAGARACRLTWTIAIEPAPLARPGAPLNRLLFNQAFRDTGRHFGAR